MHLVDTTLFYSPTSGGVKRYLTAKHAWLAAHSSWEHTIVVPGREDQFQPAEPLMGRYLRGLSERFDLVFAPSRVMCEYLEDLGVQRVSHQPLGVDAEVFHPRRRTLALRPLLGLPAQARVLIFAGRFAGEKNLPVLLQAFARLGAPYHLLLIGGERAARPAANVTVLPYRRDSLELAQWIASADALVHAGTKETFGLVILEAMACARPVVAARAGAFPALRGEREHDSPQPALWRRHRSRRDRAVELRGDLAVQVHGGGGDHPFARRTGDAVPIRAQVLDHGIVQRVGKSGRRRGTEGERGRLAGALGRAADQRETERSGGAPAAHRAAEADHRFRHRTAARSEPRW